MNSDTLLFAAPAIGFPEVSASQMFADHPELLKWYKIGCAPHPVEDIAHMHMSEQRDGITHIWILFHSDSSIVAYRQFRQEHATSIPLPT